MWERAEREISARRTAPAVLGQPRPAAHHRAGGLARGAGGLRGDVHAGRRAAALQRHGSRRHHRVRRARRCSSARRSAGRWRNAARRSTPYYRALAALRRAHPAFTRGAVRWLRNGDEQRVLSLRTRRRRRVARGRRESVVAALRGHSSTCPRASTGTSRRHTSRTRCRRTTGCDALQLPAVFLAPWEFRVFRRAIAVNTYACDCQVCAADNILAAQGISRTFSLRDRALRARCNNK